MLQHPNQLMTLYKIKLNSVLGLYEWIIPISKGKWFNRLINDVMHQSQNMKHFFTKMTSNLTFTQDIFMKFEELS